MIEISQETRDQLLELQQIDIEINRLHQLEKDIPQRKQEAALRLQPLKEQFLAARERVAQIQVDIDEFNRQIEAQRSVKQKTLYEAGTTRDNAAFRKLNAEADMCDQRISDLESEEILKLDEQQEAQQAVKSAEAEIKLGLKKVEDRLKKIEEQVVQCKEKAVVLEQKRSAMAACVDADTLRSYDRLLKSKGGTREVIVAVDDHCCGFCHLKLSAQQEAYAKVSVLTCSNCGVFIYQ